MSSLPISGITAPSGSRSLLTHVRFDDVVFASACLFVASVPLLNAFSFGGLGTVGRAAAVPLVLLSAIRVWSGAPLRRLADGHLLMILFGLWAAASVTWSLDRELSLRTAWTLAQLLLMVWLVWQVATTRDHVLTLFQFYVLGAWVSQITVLISGASSTDEPARYTVAASHPNSVAFVITLGIPVAWYLSTQTSRPAVVLMNRAFAVLSLPALMLTGSRSAVVAATAALLIIPACGPRSRRFTATTGWFLGLAVVLAVAATVLPERPFERVATFGSEVTEGDLNGRSETWDLSWDLLSENPFTGRGIGTARLALLEARGWEGGVHNTFLSISVDLGAVGLGLFLLLVSASILHGARSRRDRPFVFVLSLVLVLGLLPRHWDYERPLWLMLALLIALGEVQRSSLDPPDADHVASTRGSFDDHPSVGASTSVAHASRQAGR